MSPPNEVVSEVHMRDVEFTDDSGDPERLRIVLALAKWKLREMRGFDDPLDIESIHQHGGGLTVSWRSPPPCGHEAARAAFARAWAYVDCGEAIDSPEDIAQWGEAIEHVGRPA